MTIRRFRAATALVLFVATLPLQAQTDAVEGTLPDKIFRHKIEGRPVSGQFAINGFPMPFPAGSFANSAHQASPAVYGGIFYFPPSTVQSNVNGLGLVVLNTQLFHQGTSTNALANPNAASIQMTNVYLQLYSATVSGIPVPLGNDCIFGPILFSAQGTWNAAAATMNGSGITIPPVPSTACSGYATTLNNSIAGSNNSVSITITL
ncbi:MAG TPA: hypothetical protein VLF18_14870 [Tahibacter sp.]|uniref:hypothetical protein n=1 Tax=Tahibacter sp. TaxID=2056211 RepID=UPI002CB742FF|nr:hypothetical protein [Tahibacter sp.]HSX61481.1 hypothetical protein [Tahibacter sp.]